ncbi:MAG: SPOR domain-containing protein [Pseudomonadota bacterium]
MTPTLTIRLCAIGAALALSACDEAGNFTLSQSGASGAEVTRSANATKLVERDVEAPDVFQVTEAGLWDGRPSLGGVWVAHPDVKEPERVIIRNETNDKFVIGALFRKERETPGPKLQVSSDAATALGMIAGAPIRLDVTALRRETVEEPTEAAEGAEVLPAAAEIATTALDADPTITAAAAAIDAAAPDPQPIPETDEAEPVITPASASVAPPPSTTVAPASNLAKPFVQIGIFSIEANARRTADRMRASGIIPTVYDQESRGKRFWRVVVGPMTTESDRAEVLKTVKSLGFSDAYFVTN